MGLLQMNAFSSEGVGHNEARSELSVEASTLGLRVGHQWERLYDDAIDVGLALVNPRSGNVTRWYLHEELEQGGDVVGWELRPTTETVRKQPELRGYRFTIYND